MRKEYEYYTLWNMKIKIVGDTRYRRIVAVQKDFNVKKRILKTLKYIIL